MKYLLIFFIDMYSGILTRYNHILPVSDSRKSNHARLHKLEQDVNNILSV